MDANKSSRVRLSVGDCNLLVNTGWQHHYGGWQSASGCHQALLYHRAISLNVFLTDWLRPQVTGGEAGKLSQRDMPLFISALSGPG